MAPSLEVTSTTTALEARETRYYYNNGRCGDKTIYECEPGIIFGIIGAVVIGLAVIFYACYYYRHTAVMSKVLSGLRILMPCLRRRRKTRRRARTAKSDVEMTSVDIDDKTVTSDSTAPGQSQTAPASNSRHVRFDGPS